MDFQEAYYNSMIVVSFIFTLGVGYFSYRKNHSNSKLTAFLSLTTLLMFLISSYFWFYHVSTDGFAQAFGVLYYMISSLLSFFTCAAFYTLLRWIKNKKDRHK